MPAVSKAQRRLFALALQYKKGELKDSDASDAVKDLAKMPMKDLKDFAYTDEKGLPDKVDEEIIQPCKELVGPIEEQIPEPFKKFISITFL